MTEEQKPKYKIGDILYKIEPDENYNNIVREFKIKKIVSHVIETRENIGYKFCYYEDNGNDYNRNKYCGYYEAGLNADHH